MATRTATTHWEGGLKQGSGQVRLDSSSLGTYDVSFPKRTAEQAGGATSPEELLAAAHAACFAMQLSGVLEGAGTPPQALDTKAEVTLEPRGEGFAITGIVLYVTATVTGASDDDFASAAQKAAEICPVSAALSGTKISLEATLSG